MTTKEERSRAARNEVENYKQSVNALLAFAAFVTHEGESRRSDAEFGFGRRMTTSIHNRVKPSAEVNPDLVAQKSIQYGIVAEAKKSLGQDSSNWTDHVERLYKYDDTLDGWWTSNGTIGQSDTIMLIHQSRGRPFARFLEQQKVDDPDSVGPTTCVVEFNQSDETVTYFFFRSEFGTIHDTELGSDLEVGVSIPLDKIRQTFPSVRYYDAKPPMPLMLMHLWTDVFSSLLQSGKYNEKTKSTHILASILEVTGELQKAFGSGALTKDSRSVEFPRQKWVREAFERFVQHGLAIPDPDDRDKYTILYRAFRDDVLDRFIKLETAIEKNQGKLDIDKAQMSLFSQKDDH